MVSPEGIEPSTNRLRVVSSHPVRLDGIVPERALWVRLAAPCTGLHIARAQGGLGSSHGRLTMTAKNTLALKEDEPSCTANVPPVTFMVRNFPPGLTAHRRFRARAGTGPKWRLGPSLGRHRAGLAELAGCGPVPQSAIGGFLTSRHRFCVTGNAAGRAGFAAPGSSPAPSVVFRQSPTSSETRVPSRDVGAQRGSPRNSRSPDSSSIGAASSRSTNSNRFEWALASRRFRTISMANVVRSISQDSISGSRNATQ